jgi:DNA-directed RNA polymerase specialized sigma24 family protein
MKKNETKRSIKLTPIPDELVVRVVTCRLESDLTELRQRIFHNCRQYLFCYEDAQDATQETLYGIEKGLDKLKDMIKQFKSESTGKKRVYPGGYVTQIIRNQIINIWRAKGREKELQTGTKRDAKENVSC